MMHQHPITAALAGLVILVMTIGACQASAPAPAKATTARRLRQQKVR
jgi:hypothetical protein